MNVVKLSTITTGFIFVLILIGGYVTQSGAGLAVQGGHASDSGHGSHPGQSAPFVGRKPGPAGVEHAAGRSDGAERTGSGRANGFGRIASQGS